MKKLPNYRRSRNYDPTRKFTAQSPFFTLKSVFFFTAIIAIAVNFRWQIADVALRFLEDPVSDMRRVIDAKKDEEEMIRLVREYDRKIREQKAEPTVVDDWTKIGSPVRGGAP